MQTVIFPGFSSHNKEWADEVKEKLKENAEVIYWPHWDGSKPQPGWKEKIIDELLEKYKGQRINLIAKSVGTVIAMMLLKRNKHLVNKLILCGIPIADFMPGDENLYTLLKDFSVDNLLCIQNENDPLASYQEIKEMMNEINPDIKVISKPASDHNYPYYQDFNLFFNS